MNNVISIIRTRNNDLEFEVDIKGVRTENVDVRFVIELDDMSYCFQCNAVDETEDTWSVNVPPLPQLSPKEYPFHMEVIVDGYFFEAFTGMLTVVNEPKVTTASVHASHPIAPTVSIKPSVKNVVSSNTPDEEEEEDDYDLTIPFLSTKDNTDDETQKTIDTINTDALSIKPLTKIKEKVATDHKLSIDDIDNIVEQAFNEVNKKHSSHKNIEYSNDTEQSALASVIKEMSKEPELSEQAKKVRQLLNN